MTIGDREQIDAHQVRVTSDEQTKPRLIPILLASAVAPIGDHSDRETPRGTVASEEGARSAEMPSNTLPPPAPISDSGQFGGDAHTFAAADPGRARALVESSDCVPAQTSSDGHRGAGAQMPDAVAVDDGGQCMPATQEHGAPVVDEIRAWHRRRIFVQDTRKRMDNALGAFIRSSLGWSLDLPAKQREAITKRASALVAAYEKAVAGKPAAIDDDAYAEFYDVALASIASRAPFTALEKQCTKSMERLAKQLPVADWCGEQKGLGLLSLATIIGDAGDLGTYSNPAKVWKRLGLAVMSGTRQGGLTKSASKDDWIEHGYNARRRSRMWNVGVSLLRSGNEHYRAIYDARKAQEIEKAAEEGLEVLPAAKIKDKTKARSEGHVHKRAQRYMEKRLIRDLWKAWRRASLHEASGLEVPAAEDTAA